MSQGEEPSRKRVSARQLTDRDDVDDEVEGGGDNGTWRKADATIMQTRKIAKVRGKGPSVASDVATPSPPTTDSAPPKPFSFSSFTQGDKKEDAKPATPEKTPQETNGTPAKAEATPTKETLTTPTKEATPAKEATTPAKEGESKEATTPAKESTPAKAEGTPEAPKAAFSFPTTFSFPTSFTSTPFSFPTLASTTTPAFSTTTPAFSFPSVNNFSAGGSSIFSAGGAAKKEGSDDEGDNAANPEEEVAITGPNTLPIVQTVTGEEDENTLFTVRAKLFALLDGKWQERGVGQLKLNKDKSGKCRLLMRDQGGKHLRLNTPVFSEMKIDKTADKSVQFVAIGNGGAEGTAAATTTAKPFTTFAVRVARKEEATDLFEALTRHKASSSSSSSSASPSPASSPAPTTTSTTTSAST